MRTTFLIILLSAYSTLAREIPLTDKQRTERSVAVFTATITSTNFLRELQVGALYSAQIKVESIEKSHPDLKTNSVIYFEQTYTAQDESNTHGYICPSYPDLSVGQTVKFWCIRRTVEGHTNVLFVPTSSWAKRR